MTPEQLAEAMEMGADALSIYSDTDCRDAMIRLLAGATRLRAAPQIVGLTGTVVNVVLTLPAEDTT